MIRRFLEGRTPSPTQGDPGASPPTRALQWIRAHEKPSGGIRVHSTHNAAYPEVSGYLVPTLLQYGERELAIRLMYWLLRIQRVDGSFPGPDDGKSYVFDTGQVLRGLLAGINFVEGALDAARRAADFICSQLADDNTQGFHKQYNGDISESIHLYVLPALLETAKVFDDERYRRAAEQCANFYCGQTDSLSLDMLTHFLAYNIEALIDIGQTDLVLTTLERLREEQSSDGSVRGRRGVRWVCTPGLAQLAVCWYKVGSWQAADKAINWLENHQNPSGGFFGSYGADASYFPTVEISWAAKFYLDANTLRIKSSFDRNVATFPASISKADGRVKAILEKVQPTSRVLEVGCGKGRFLRAIKDTYPQAKCTGVDISSTLLSYVPEGIQRFEGTMEALTFPADSFDIVFSVEAIEHSPNLSAAIGEMTRVVRPGGWVIVIDKHKGQWGRLKCAEWERWPKESEIRELLTRGCDNISSNYVAYDNKPASDGLMMVWSGRKKVANEQLDSGVRAVY